ncbi:hypothetical protein F5I97DRAFT_1906004 [Phlebopus sp. FC_14]|nr:hypothetical protein F5I97DRAFT_1906004 [Phlebopus sp. FC_14]
MKRPFWALVCDQWSTLPPVETTDLSGKTVVVVGANVGIGFEAAKHFARMKPARLILACRSESKGKAAVTEIQEQCGSNACELWLLDLADFSSVTSFADKFLRESDRLDILVMNAGMATGKYETTTNGWERTYGMILERSLPPLIVSSRIQVNHLATALLSLLLLPRLVETGKKTGIHSRLVIVASDVHYWAVLKDDVKHSQTPLAKLSNKEYCTPKIMAVRYFDSKVLNVLFVRALQDHIPSVVPLTVNAVNPGFCYSQLRREMYASFWRNLFMSLMEKALAWTPEQGSRQLIYAAIAERDNEDHMKGAFVSKAEVAEPSDFVISDEGKMMQDKIWSETIDILTKEVPQLKSSLQEYLAV